MTLSYESCWLFSWVQWQQHTGRWHGKGWSRSDLQLETCSTWKIQAKLSHSKHILAVPMSFLFSPTPSAYIVSVSQKRHIQRSSNCLARERLSTTLLAFTICLITFISSRVESRVIKYFSFHPTTQVTSLRFTSRRQSNPKQCSECVSQLEF